MLEHTSIGTLRLSGVWFVHRFHHSALCQTFDEIPSFTHINNLTSRPQIPRYTATEREDSESIRQSNQRPITQLSIAQSIRDAAYSVAGVGQSAVRPNNQPCISHGALLLLYQYQWTAASRSNGCNYLKTKR